ncbi:MAG TPA: C40 family peptidase [Gaiellaceae bacterium]
MRRPALIVAACCCALASGAPASANIPPPPAPGTTTTPTTTTTTKPAKPAAGSWAASSIRTVVTQGLMGPDVATFRPQDPLTRGDLAELVAGLTGQLPQPVTNPTATVSIAALDSKLVGALGLAPAAAELAQAARDGGLNPPTRFGTEVIARLLGLRFNHPAAQDDLELLPTDPATRAEAAYSAARILAFDGSQEQRAADAAATFVLPFLGPWQTQILQTAFSLVGYPYVWGGTSERAEQPFGVKARGGFDCSGFVWRVYKLQPYPGAPTLAETLRGRTTYAMSGEVPTTKRVPYAKLQPGDVVFFGAQGPRSKPSQVDHAGIYAGSGWFVHSSSQGVTLTQLSGWYRQRFAWARRPLAEAGLGT